MSEQRCPLPWLHQKHLPQGSKPTAVAHAGGDSGHLGTDFHHVAAELMAENGPLLVAFVDMQIGAAYTARFDLDDDPVWLEYRIRHNLSSDILRAVHHSSFHCLVLSSRWCSL